jgi:hypothetical protein
MLHKKNCIIARIGGLIIHQQQDVESLYQFDHQALHFDQNSKHISRNVK